MTPITTSHSCQTWEAFSLDSLRSPSMSLSWPSTRFSSLITRSRIRGSPASPIRSRRTRAMPFSMLSTFLVTSVSCVRTNVISPLVASAVFSSRAWLSDKASRVLRIRFACVGSFVTLFFLNFKSKFLSEIPKIMNAFPKFLHFQFPDFGSLVDLPDIRNLHSRWRREHQGDSADDEQNHPHGTDTIE